MSVTLMMDLDNLGRVKLLADKRENLYRLLRAMLHPNTELSLTLQTEGSRLEAERIPLTKEEGTKIVQGQIGAVNLLLGALGVRVTEPPKEAEEAAA